MTEIGTAMVCFEDTPFSVFHLSDMVLATGLGFTLCWVIVLLLARRRGL